MPARRALTIYESFYHRTIMKNFQRILALTAVAGLLWSQSNRPTAAQKEAAERRAYIKANYTKHEFLVPMRDGVRLFTSIYTPKDPSQQYPFMLNRTPYTVAPYGIDNYRGALGPSD